MMLPGMLNSLAQSPELKLWETKVGPSSMLRRGSLVDLCR